jgi:hypothetical protein
MKVYAFLLFALMTVLAPAVFAQAPDIAQSRDLTAEITIQKTVYDFETLLEGDIAVHTFVVENTGNAPLVIKKIKTGCGCTTVDYTRGEIAPGAEGHVTLRVSTEGYGGRKITKSATVQTNDPNQKGLKLRMTGNVARFADIDPKRIELVGSPGETVRTIVKIVPSEAYPFHIIGEPETGKNTYRCTLEEKNGIYILTAENIATKNAVYFDTVVLKTDHPAKPEIEIRVVGRIKTESQPEAGD